MDLKVKQILEVLETLKSCCPGEFKMEEPQRCDNIECYQCWYNSLINEKDEEKIILKLEELENENTRRYKTL